MYVKMSSRFAKVLSLVICTALACVLLSNNRTIGSGIREGMSLCVEVIVPSLFPFLVFTSFLTLSSFGQQLSELLSPVTRYLFRLPEQAGATVFMSFIGGYPVGGRMISRLMKDGSLTREDGERMLSFCVNAGPSFIISAVGARLFENTAVGILLLMSHLLTSLSIGIIRGWRHPVPPKKFHRTETADTSVVSALIRAVSDSASGMLTLCSFIVLFSGLLALLTPLREQFGFWGSLFCGLVEVTQGCVIACELPGVNGEALAAFLLSFSGLSVICQAAAGFSSFGEILRPAVFLFWRTVSGFCAAGWYLLLRLCFGDFLYHAQAVFGWVGAMVQPTAGFHSTSIPMTICLLALCAIAALTLEEET